MEKERKETALRIKSLPSLGVEGLQAGDIDAGIQRLRKDIQAMLMWF
jgi:hypothetical protein